MNAQRTNDSTLNDPKRHRVQITREGWVAIALTGWVLVSALITHASLTLLVFCTLVAVLLVGAVETYRNVRKIEVTRRLPEQAVAGRPFHLELDVRNRRVFGAAQGLVLACNAQPGSGESPSTVFLPCIPPRGHVTERIEVVLPKRGLYRFKELELSSRFPFGFLERIVSLGEAQDLLVFPRLGKLKRRFFEVDREDHPHQEGRRPGPATLEADYHGLRDYRDGDSPRWIHWATSARRGRWMVKEFEGRHNRDVALLLDPWLPNRPDADAEALLEKAISFTATLCVELCERHSLHIVLGIAGSTPIVRHGQSSSRLLRELLAELALVRGTSDTRWEEVFRELPTAWTSQMRITAISPRPLELVSRCPSAIGSAKRRWQQWSRRLVEVNVARGDLNDFFELH